MMNKPIIQGVFNPYIKDFMALKHNLGFKASGMETSLNAFDRFARSKGVDQICITESLSMEWCSKRNGEANNTRSHRINFLRQFCIYLLNLGFNVYIPRIIPFKKDDNFVPYIYSDEEINAIYKATDSLRLYDLHMNNALFIMPALVRMLFATGLRIGEALALKMDDVNMEAGFLIITLNPQSNEAIAS